MAPSVLIFLSMLMVMAPYHATSRSGKHGGWMPFDNLNDPEAVKYAKFALAEYNKETAASLTFVALVKVDTQLVAGRRYRLDISAKDGDADSPKKYRAVVLSQRWLHIVQLTSFEEIDDQDYRPAYSPQI
ncbi:cysteine proteinase inhibitor [Striga asiatica]|uniref:Cysteine proteinase inhibitor n=1 Tax=Striga asiatica TaxID=4170 RepID=A0A5A7PFV6_STRAF|nr:cysteine proteinase inhibitor [Striga asiatica]